MGYASTETDGHFYELWDVIMRILPQIGNYPQINEEIREIFVERLKVLKDEWNIPLENR